MSRGDDRGGRAPRTRLSPSVAAAASPAGRVTREIYDHVKDADRGRPRARGPWTGVLLDLHGAMVPEGLDDGEGDLIAAARTAVGPGVPIAVTLDFHANLHGGDGPGRRSPARLQDLSSRGHGRAGLRGDRAASRGDRRAHPADRGVPQASAPATPRKPGPGPDAPALRPRRRDGAGPAGDLGVDLRRLPHADIPDAGLGVYVVTDGAPELAERLAEELARARGPTATSSSTRLPVTEAVARALAADGRPIVLADMADNTGAARPGRHRGAPGAGAGRARSAVVAQFVDPAAVQACVRAGVGAASPSRSDGRWTTATGRPSR